MIWDINRDSYQRCSSRAERRDSDVAMLGHLLVNQPRAEFDRTFLFYQACPGHLPPRRARDLVLSFQAAF